MDLFQIAVIAFLAIGSCAVLAGIGATVVSSERRSPSRRKKTGIAPGWYPDAQDETLLRYFDGREPTRQTSRREHS